MVCGLIEAVLIPDDKGSNEKKASRSSESLQTKHINDNTQMQFSPMLTLKPSTMASPAIPALSTSERLMSPTAAATTCIF